jgi:hypothetical protein
MTVVNTSLPALSGSFLNGHTVQTTDGEWTFDDDYLTYAYQWERCNAVGASCVDIVGATDSSYTITGADIGSTLRAEVTATEHVSAVSGDLLFSPPTLSSPSTFTVSSGNRTLDGGGGDWNVVMPATPLTGRSGDAALVIKNVHNVKLIGGEILINTPYSTGSVASQQGVFITGTVTGEVFIEGLWVHGTSVGQAILIACGAGTVTIQNSRLETYHTVGTIHTDAIQTYSGPHTLQMYQNTLYSNGLSLQMQPREFCSGCSFGTWHYERQDMHQVTAQAPALNKSASGKAWWAEYHEDFWLEPNPSHSQPIMVNWSYAPNGWSPAGGTNVSGEALNIGTPGGGNFVPLGVAGTGYVSPGYQ